MHTTQSDEINGPPTSSSRQIGKTYNDASVMHMATHNHYTIISSQRKHTHNHVESHSLAQSTFNIYEIQPTNITMNSYHNDKKIAYHRKENHQHTTKSMNCPF
mmetsp:Transcript_6400/g.11702  ORF Transcript_6400/g.11702 Transcript_6400/m.11702 type:complete len:103 (+) Transcript_6400:29-337(+)